MQRLFVILILALPLAAADAAAQVFSSAYPLFEDTTPLTLRIAAPFVALRRDIPDDRPEYDAVIELPGDDGASQTLEIAIRIRGRSRVDHCDFPPLSLRMPPDASDTVFAGQKRLKLVTLCKRAEQYRDYLTLEFLIYRMFNVLTNRSFRVRWANIEYQYTDNRRQRVETAPAFLLEADWEVAERLGMVAVDVETIEIAELDPQYEALVFLFQYLIGNTDWAVLSGPPGDRCCHNGEVVGAAGGPSIVLPYDFDTSGMISAEYAAPSDNLPIRTVRQRLYRGFCAMNANLDEALELLNQRREQLFALLDDDTLSQRSRDRAVDYLSESFAIFNDSNERQEQINGRCRE